MHDDLLISCSECGIKIRSSLENSTMKSRHQRPSQISVLLILAVCSNQRQLAKDDRATFHQM